MNRLPAIFNMDNDPSTEANMDGLGAAVHYHSINSDDQVNSRDAYQNSYDNHCTQLTQQPTFETFENEETNLCVSSPRAREQEDQHREEWGLLRRRDGKEEIKLLYRTKDGRRDTYSIGRSSKCDVAVKEDKTVSATHCIVYCDYLQARLRVFVEDSSANGTFVNDSLTRLTKGQRLELKSGDEILLHNPRSNFHKSGREGSHEENDACHNELIAKSSFMFINLRDRVVGQRQVAMAPFSNPKKISPEKAMKAHVEDYYIIGDQIGSGMCGTVHLCVHKKTGEHYAVKIIDTKKFSLTPGLSPLELREEADMMRNLNHTSIIRIIDTYETDNVIFIVMELMRGGDLFERIVERGRYDEATARAVMSKILSAVEYLHIKEIIHRDLKPENILLLDPHDDTNIKITDFGLAKRANHEGLKTFCGTPQYFAPEVLKRKSSVAGTGRYGMSADMWSVGVILYILLSGTFPFEEDNLFDQIQNAEYSFTGSEWSNISESAKHLVRGLMTLRPELRLSVEQAMTHPWMMNQSFAAPPQTPNDNKKAASATAAVSVNTKDKGKSSSSRQTANKRNNIFGSQQSVKAAATSGRRSVAKNQMASCESIAGNLECLSSANSMQSQTTDEKLKLSNLWFWSNKQSIIDKVGTGGSAASTHIENLIAKVADTPLYKKSMANRANIMRDSYSSSSVRKTMESEINGADVLPVEIKSSVGKKRANDRSSVSKNDKRQKKLGVQGIDISDDLMDSKELSDDNIEDCSDGSDVSISEKNNETSKEAIIKFPSSRNSIKKIVKRQTTNSPFTKKSPKTSTSPKTNKSPKSTTPVATLTNGFTKKISMTSVNTNNSSSGCNSSNHNPNLNFKQGSLELAWGKVLQRTRSNRENVNLNTE